MYQPILTLIGLLKKNKVSFSQWHKLTLVYRVTIGVLTTEPLDYNAINYHHSIQNVSRKNSETEMVLQPLRFSVSVT